MLQYHIIQCFMLDFVFYHTDVSKNRGKPPKWMVKIMVPNPIKHGMIWGYPNPYFWGQHPYYEKLDLYVGLSPFPVTVTTRIITFLVGNPYKPSFPLLLGGGTTQPICNFPPFQNHRLHQRAEVLFALHDPRSSRGGANQTHSQRKGQTR